MRLLLIIGGWVRNPFNDMDHLTEEWRYCEEKFFIELGSLSISSEPPTGDLKSHSNISCFARLVNRA